MVAGAVDVVRYWPPEPCYQAYVNSHHRSWTPVPLKKVRMSFRPLNFPIHLDGQGELLQVRPCGTQPRRIGAGSD